MEIWKSAVMTKEAELISKGWKLEAAHKRALKSCRCLHPSHKMAMAQRIELADTAAELTNQFHAM